MKHITTSKDWDNKNIAEKGFTLVELLVVIAILGILAVVGVLAFGGLTDSAQDAVDETELAQVQTAADAFHAQTGSPAAAVTDLTDQLKDPSALNCEYTFTNGVVTQDAGTCDD